MKTTITAKSKANGNGKHVAVTVKAKNGNGKKTAKKSKKQRTGGETDFYKKREQFEPVPMSKLSKEATELLALAKKVGAKLSHPVTSKLGDNGSAIRVYVKTANGDKPILQIRSFTKDTPNVFIHVAGSEEERKKFFNAVLKGANASKPHLIWAQPKGWSAFQYVSKKPELLVKRVKDALPELINQASL
jgi:hypothetical protein